MKFTSAEFKKLRREWYKKLREDGFDDIEKGDYELKEPTMPLPSTYEETYQYFTFAKRYLESGHFHSSKDKVIWFMHSEGWTGKEIAKVLSTSESTVSRTIALYDKRMFG